MATNQENNNFQLLIGDQNLFEFVSALKEKY